MPGWYIHMDVARKAIDALDQNKGASSLFASNGLSAQQIAKIAHDNPVYVAVGAIGPDIFFLLPDFKPPVGNMLWKLATTIRDLFTEWDDTFLTPYESAMGPISANATDEINAITGGLEDVITGIFTEATKLLEDWVITLITQQFDFFGLLSSGVPAGFDEQTFFWSDMLHYRQTYRFGAELWKRASDPTVVPDADARARFQAFALGWISHLATDVTGHSFVNEKAGGPYRLHWQRHHLVENHMDALVYNSDHGTQSIYQEMSNAALHLWLAFNPDGSSRVDFFQDEPNPAYPDGDSSSDIVGRHAIWDFDSDIPDDLAQFISDTLKAVFVPSLATDADGMLACCPTIISTLDNRVPLVGNGYAEKEDVVGAYWWLYKYVKWLTTDFYSIRRPDAPSVVVIPSFPSPPGSGDADPGPGATPPDPSALAILLMIFAWILWVAEVIAWPAAAIAGIVNGTATYTLREALYEAIELPLYNMWLAIHTFLAMTGYVMPMPGEINSGLTTLGVSVDADWSMIIAALGDFDGDLAQTQTHQSTPGETAAAGYPRDVVLDTPTVVGQLMQDLISIGLIPSSILPPSVNGELPSEFTRPWRWPEKNDAGTNVNFENPKTVAGPFATGADATALFGSSPGSANARSKFEGAQSEAETIAFAQSLLANGEHLGDPVDYTGYLIAMLTRTNLDPSKVPSFNLDSDRGYAYLCWDWVRDNDRESIATGFKGLADPQTGQPDNISQHVYRSPVEPGYGWDPSTELGVAKPRPGFDPTDPNAAVRIRYIDRQPKF